MKTRKIELLFEIHCFPQLNFSFIVPRYQIHSLSIQKMKASSLKLIAGSTKLLLNHLLAVQREFEELDATAKSSAKSSSGALRLQHTLPILALMTDISDHRRMVIRTVQVQRTQINKYSQSIRNGRKIKRGQHAPTDMVMEVMVKMAMRFIGDLKETLTELTQPIITRIHTKLHDLHDRMSMFQMFVDGGQDQDQVCQCNSVGISCSACHNGAHDQCQHNCTE